MTASVKTKADPQAKVKATPPKNAAKATSTEAPAARAPRPNPAQSDDATRAKVTQAMSDLAERGFTRPAIADATGLTKGAVWRAQNDRVHTAEVPVVEELIKRVLSGELKPPTRVPTRVSATELQARVTHAVELLRSQADAKSVSALRKLVGDALQTLEDGSPASTADERASDA